MSHRQTERRSHVPSEPVNNFVHTAEEMQAAIAEIANLEQQLAALKKTTYSFLDWQQKFQAEMINPLVAHCSILLAGQCTCSDVDDEVKG
jgi:hypothetical protein